MKQQPRLLSFAHTAQKYRGTSTPSFSSIARRALASSSRRRSLSRFFRSRSRSRTISWHPDKSKASSGLRSATGLYRIRDTCRRTTEQRGWGSLCHAHEQPAGPPLPYLSPSLSLLFLTEELGAGRRFPFRATHTPASRHRLSRFRVSSTLAGGSSYFDFRPPEPPRGDARASFFWDH